MKLSTPHQKSVNVYAFPGADVCLQCEKPWPCDAAIACEEIETLNRVIARLVKGWQARTAFTSDRPPEWRRYALGGGCTGREPMSDAEAEALRPHLETRT